MSETGEKISRRKILGNIAKVAYGSAIAGDILYGSKAFKEKYEIDPQIEDQLESIASTIKDNIKDSTHLKSPDLPVSLNSDNFARMILTLAYLDGGMSAVNKVKDQIDKNGLEIATNRTMVEGSISVEGEPWITIKDSYLRDYPYSSSPMADMVFMHEAYHFIQFCRNPELYTNTGKLGLPTALAGGALGVKIATTDHKKDTRRKFLSRAGKIAKAVVAFPVGAFIARAAEGTVDPYEVQANMQTGTFEPLYEGLSKSEPMQKFRGRLFNKKAQ